MSDHALSDTLTWSVICSLHVDTGDSILIACWRDDAGANAISNRFHELLSGMSEVKVAQVCDRGVRNMKMKAYASFDEYLKDQTSKNQGVIRALRTFVKRVAPNLEESVKWGNGCWLKDKAPVAYVYSAHDHVQFGFFRGSALKDPKGLLRGEGKFVRHIRLARRSEIDEKSFGVLLRQASGN